MLRFGVYLVGLVLVLGALWYLLTTLGVLAALPATLVVVVLLLVAGLAIMRGAWTVQEVPVGPPPPGGVVERKRVVEHGPSDRRRWRG